MKRFSQFASLIFCLIAAQTFAERINHEGRILGALPVVTNSVVFNTTNADAIVSAMQIFPVTNPWNEDISRRSAILNSDAMIGQIISDLRSDRRTLVAFHEMNFVLVPDNQPRLPIHFLDYPDESDLDGGTFPYGSYPIATNTPVETWPHETGTQTLADWQQNDDGSDRHSILVQPGNGFVWETWRTVRTDTNWESANGAKFDLKSNALRPNGWTSADAAGLPMFPALPRFDECERGVVEHACRIVVKRTKYNSYIYPATHYASYATNTSTNLPSMGQRVRLKASFAIPANWTKQEKAVLQALKKYGALVADNGNFFSISVTPDDRWPANCFNHFTSISITNFEVIQTTGINEGPRSPGPPIAYAGADQFVSLGSSANLQGFVSYTSAPPLTVKWKSYSGPGTVAFGNSVQTNTTAIFTNAGTYTLMLSASNGVHAVAYDAVLVTVTQATSIALSIAISGTNANLNWAGGAPPYVLEKAGVLHSNAWSIVLTTNGQSANVRITTNDFFRVRGQSF